MLSMRNRIVSKQRPHATRDVEVDPDPRALRWEKWLCVTAVTGVIVVAATLFLYAHPLADDFARAYKGRVYGVVPATIHEYFTWTGRWSASGLNYFLTSSFDLVRIYPLLLIITPALLGGSVYVLLWAAEIGSARFQRLALTAAALALYWVGMPHPGETVYWLTGSGDNLTGLSLSLLLLAGLLRYRPRTIRISFAVGAVFGLLAVLATGFHELFSLLLCIMLAGGTLKAWLARDPRRWMWTACLAAALIGFVVVFTAPGNFVRRANFPFAGKLGVTLLLTVRQARFNVIRWVFDMRLLTGTALLLMLVPRALTRQRHSPNATTRDLVIVALTWITAMGAAFAAPSWATGMKMPPRTLNGIYLVFLTGWFWVLVMLTRHFAGQEELMPVATPLMRRMVVAIFVAAMLLTGNTWRALSDLRGVAPAYSKAMHNRWRSLQAARAHGELDAVVEPLPKRPKSYIRYFELREDPEYWENWSVAHYFGLRTVRLASDTNEDR
jgi:Family of unknown function (DUF6056)